MRKSSDFLLNLRLSFYSAAIVHLIFAAVIILSIDMSKDEDPRVSVYVRLRWKLITCWFNLLLLAYFPISFYCDWKEKKGRWNEERVRKLRKLRDYMMTSILFPTTMYSDLTFWLLWIKDPALIAPVAIFRYLPVWAQHSLHTASGVKVFLDILLLPRRRPRKWLPNVVLMLAFIIIYLSVITISQLNGENVYSFLGIFNPFEITLFVMFSLTQMLFFYTLQWYIVDFIWGKNTQDDIVVNGVCNGINGVKNHNIKSN